MKYSHWYRKLFIRTETPKFDRYIDIQDYSELIPEMVQKYWNLNWEWEALLKNPHFNSLLICDKNVSDTTENFTLHDYRNESFGTFMEKIIDMCGNKEKFIQKLDHYINSLYGYSRNILVFIQGNREIRDLVEELDRVRITPDDFSEIHGRKFQIVGIYYDSIPFV